MSPVIPTTKYNQRALTRLFIKYYDCTKEEFRVFNPKRVALLKVGVMASYTFTKLNYNFTHINAQKGTEATTASGIGISLQGRVSPNVFLIGELTFSGPYSHDEQRIKFIGPDYSVESTYNYRATSRKASLLVQYEKPVNNFYVFANGGIALDRINGYFDLKQTTTYILTPTTNNTHYSNRFTANHLLVGVGVIYSNFSFETRLEPSLLNKYQGTAKSFILGYTFGNILP
jgi:hypothetical protein